MGAYTPGLKVTPEALLHFERRLPLTGSVEVKVGDTVKWDQVVAKTNLPGRVEMVNLASKLGVGAAELPEILLKKEGEAIEKGEILAYSKGFFGLFKAPYRSPITGTLESVSKATGQVILRCPPRPIDIKAYVDGVVEEVEKDQGVTIKTFGSLIQGIFGLGGETGGELALEVSGPAEIMSAGQLHSGHRGQVLVIGKIATAAVVRRAAELGVAALIAGGIDDSDVRELLGYDLGVAITGNEKLGVTLVVTEGFGPLEIADKTFELLKSRVGRRASVSGATQIRAGVIRPEIIVTDLAGDWEKQAVEAPDLELAVGVPVRLIREPKFGHLGKVIGLPVQPVLIPSGAKVRVAEIELGDGETITLPRANLELIEG
jgi:hypothetical protein